MASRPIDVRLWTVLSTSSSTIPSALLTHLPFMASIADISAVLTPEDIFMEQPPILSYLCPRIRSLALTALDAVDELAELVGRNLVVVDESRHEVEITVSEEARDHSAQRPVAIVGLVDGREITVGIADLLMREPAFRLKIADEGRDRVEMRSGLRQHLHHLTDE